MSYPFQGAIKATPKSTADISGIYTVDTALRQKTTNGNWPPFLYSTGPETIIASGYVPGSWQTGDVGYKGGTSQEFIKVRMLKQDPQYSQALVAWYNDTTHYLHYNVIKANKVDGTITSSAVQVGAALTAYPAAYGPFIGRTQRVQWDCAADVANSRFWMVHYDDSYVTGTPYAPNPFGASWQITMRATTKVNVGTADTSNTISMGTANITGVTTDRFILGFQDTRRPAPNTFMSDDYYYDAQAIRTDCVGSNKVLAAIGDLYATITSPNNNTATFSAVSATVGSAVTFKGPRATAASSRMIPCGSNKALHIYSFPTPIGLGYLPAYVGSAGTSATVLTVIDHSSTPTLTHYRYTNSYTYTNSAVGLGTTAGGVSVILAGIGTTSEITTTHSQGYMTILNVNNSTGVLTTQTGKWDVTYDGRDSFSIYQHGITSLYPYNFERGIIGQYAYYTNNAGSSLQARIAIKAIKPNSIGITPLSANNYIDRYGGAQAQGVQTRGTRVARSLLKISENQFLEVGYASTITSIVASVTSIDPVFVSNYNYIV